MNTINLLAIWFGCSVSTLIFSLFLVIYISQDKVVATKNQTYRLFQALPQDQITVNDQVGKVDARTQIVKSFFENHGSSLAQLSDLFVEVADKYQLDHRLLPAIAMQESNGGKRVPEGSFNPFGYGIYGATVTHFNSWEDAIWKVGQKLREDYLNKGLATPYEIMTKYTPPSLEKGGPWAAGVSQFMSEQR